MKYTVKPTSRFQKDLKLAVKRGYDINKLNAAVKLLANGEPLPERMKDHPLKGSLEGKRECHIEPDWLLIYEYDNGNLFLYLSRTGSHSSLFKK